MNDQELAKVKRRARTDAIMLIQHKLPVACPYASVLQATHWRKEFDAILVELRSANQLAQSQK
jgi:hypothetical protein